MKTKMFQAYMWIFAVGSAVTLLGCQDRTSRAGDQTTAVADMVDPATSLDQEDKDSDTAPARATIPPANLSPLVAEIVKLAESGIGEEVLVAYVEKSSHLFNPPSVDEIVYLKDIGVPDSVLAAIVRQGSAPNESAKTSMAAEIAENKTMPLEWQTNSSGSNLMDSAAAPNPVAAEPNYSNPVAVAPPQEVNVNYFENTLSPYGTWVNVVDYGRCWQPTVVLINRNWRPYADRGQWVYTSCGWYWQSDYAWGWAPFHYGRWLCDSQIGWVWVPGSTWGPAWVSWRYTDQYCGWAPLPPTARYVSGVGFRYQNSHVGISFDFGLSSACYTFIPTSRFCERNPSRYYVSGSQSKTIYQNSVVINNYVCGNNNTIINEGVGRERIAHAIQKPIQTVTLQELAATENPTGRAERFEGNKLTVFRPKVSAHAGGTTVPSAGTPNSFGSHPSQRTFAKTELPPTTQTQAPTTSTVPSEQMRKTFVRTASPTIVARNSPSKVEQPPLTSSISPNSGTRPGISATRTVISLPPNTDSSSQRILHSPSSAQPPNRNNVAREGNTVSTENTRSYQRNTPFAVTPAPAPRETRIAAPTTIRAQPSVAQSQQLQQAPRENPRPSSPVQNPSSVQRSVRSMAPASVQSAPAPVQNLRPQPVIRSESQNGKPFQQFNQPSRPMPQPSVRQSALSPQAAPVLSERNIRFGRNGS